MSGNRWEIAGGNHVVAALPVKPALRAGLACAVMGLVLGTAAKEYITAPKAGAIKPPTEEWVARIESLAPGKPTAVPAKPRKVLVFSLATGFKHTVAPHVKEVAKVLAEKSGAFEVVLNDDIAVFEKGSLAQYDAVLLNNVCPDRERRDVFWDVLKEDDKAAAYEANLLDYVAGGGGLVVIHGAIAFQNNSAAVSEMIGGSFDWHPKFQMVTLDLVDPVHPLVGGFEGKGFVHQDEPYLFKNAYKEKSFRPLLEMDVSKLNAETLEKKAVADGVKYVAWIKPHGDGRVFYCSPSHHPASYETEAMLRFLLDGTQYALGDLRCDDSPMIK
ncbi:ThuA domain-containing protein [Pontiellaceae bacterium B12227]|nr:ThuA domain-containing protein [Pontiellaceae bacterium B12227]